MVQTEKATTQNMEYHQLANNKTKLVILSVIIIIFISMLTIHQASAVPVNKIKNIIKVEGAYPVDTATFDVDIDPPLTDLTKTFVFMSFSHNGEEDHSDTFRSWDLIDADTLRIYGENTAVGNNAEEFTAYIVEFEGDVAVQQSTRTTTASESEGEKSVTISAVTTAETMTVAKGHNHNADETTVASEELDRIRLLTTTTWGWLVFDTPNTGDQINRVDVVDWNTSTIAVQRGIVTMANGVTSTTVTPSTAVDRTRTILLVSYACGTGCTTSEEPNDFMLRATLDGSNNIVITRNASEDDMQIAWQVIQFPADEVKVTYDQMTLAGGTLVQTDTIATAVKDYDKTIVMSPVSTPFGFSTGSTDTATTGAIDRSMTHLLMANQDVVQAERGDSTGTMTLEYEVVEFLEPVVAQHAQGTNVLHQIVKIDGTYTAGNDFQDYTISPALTNTDKTLVFLNFNSTNNGASIGSAVYGKSWEITSPTNLRVYGSQDTTELGASFIATIVEFTNSSPIFSQYDHLQYSSNLADASFTMAMSTVNTTGSFILPEGGTNALNDPTIGSEEIGQFDLASSTSWTMEADTVQNEAGTVKRAMIADFNDDDVFVQRGTGTLTGTTTTVTPSTSIDRTKSLLFVTYRTTDDVVSQPPNVGSIKATLDGSNNIVISRDTSGATINFSWQIVTFPSNQISVQHGIHSKTAGQQTGTSTVTSVGTLANSFAIGTVSNGLMGLSVGSGSTTTGSDFDSTTGTIKLTNANTVTFTRGDENGSWDVGYQVVEFLNGTTFNQIIEDTATTTDKKELTVNKTAVDFSVSVDSETQTQIIKQGSDLASVNEATEKDVTKQQSDTATVTDTATTSAIFIVNLDDTGTATDVVRINMTKAILDSVLVNKNLIVNGTSNSTEFPFDVVLGLDSPTFNVTKLLADLSAVTDQTVVTRTRDLSLLDNTSANDLIILNITKNISDTAEVTDTIDITRIRDVILDDEITTNDPSIILKITSVPANQTGGGGGGGAGVPTFQRLVGLSITSEYFNVVPADRVPSDFIISTFGRDDTIVKIKKIEATQQFASWFEFSSFPDPLEFDTKVDNTRTVNDPARFKNIALDDFVLNIPRIACSDTSPFDSPVPCIDPIIYKAPLIFTFEKGGIEFKEKHVVTIDASSPAKCDPICQLVAFMTANYWWLAGILIMFVVVYFVIGTVRNSRIRTVRRVNAKHFTSFEAGKPKKKFKRGRR